MLIQLFAELARYIESNLRIAASYQNMGEELCDLGFHHEASECDYNADVHFKLIRDLGFCDDNAIYCEFMKYL